MKVKKLTPLMFVEEIESCLAFWQRLGFENAAEVPEGDKLGFVILKKDDVEVMYQTRTSVSHDIPQLADSPQRGSFLYFEVDDINEVEKLIPSNAYVIPRRTTFYGSQEIVAREPAGNVVVFSQFGA